jgi:protein transport protein SEC61 subunit gamma-like protein
MKLNIREKLTNYVRVLKIAKKPSREDFAEALKICAMGLFAVGMLGYMVYILSILFLG